MNLFVGWTAPEYLETANSAGHLPGILDAVRSHRVANDFSAQWSNAREDFERKLYCKRNKIWVRFVELTNTIPVQGAESEVAGTASTRSPNGLVIPITARSRRSSPRSVARPSSPSGWISD